MLVEYLPIGATAGALLLAGLYGLKGLHVLGSVGRLVKTSVLLLVVAGFLAAVGVLEVGVDVGAAIDLWGWLTGLVGGVA